MSSEVLTVRPEYIHSQAEVMCGPNLIIFPDEPIAAHLVSLFLFQLNRNGYFWLHVNTVTLLNDNL